MAEELTIFEKFVKDVKSDKSGVHCALEELKSDAKYIYPFYCTPLDIAFGGGVYSGKIYEIYGQPSHGKSTLAIEAAKAFCYYWKIRNEENYAILFIETESVFDKIRAKYMGLPIERVLVSEAETVEEGFNVIDKTVQKAIAHKFKLFIIWDTIAAAPTSNEKEKGTFAGGMMEKPRVIRQALRKITTSLGNADATLIFVNQVYESMDMYHPEPVSPGGGGIKFHASVRIYIRQTEEIKELALTGMEMSVGIISECFFSKNKLTLPKQRVPIFIYGERGFNSFKTLFRFLSVQKIFQSAGAWKYIEFKDQKYNFQNEEGLLEIIKVKEPKLAAFMDYMVLKIYGARSPLMKVKLIEPIWDYEQKELGGKITTLTDEELELAKMIYKQIQEECDKETIIQELKDGAN